jgi:hypothetical protein
MNIYDQRKPCLLVSQYPIASEYVVVYDLTLLEGCAQAILVEGYFSNFVNIESFQQVYF